VFASKLGELLRRALANRPVDNPDPTSLSSARGTTGAGGVGHHCSVLREHAPLRPSGRCVRVPWAARHPSFETELEVAVARGLCPPFVGGARPHPLVENCRASTSIKNEETPKLQRANGGCLGARCR
jgi:hypothetical protein